MQFSYFSLSASSQHHFNSFGAMNIEHIPYYVLPFFAVSKVKEYSEELTKVIKECNQFYKSFISKNIDFLNNGQVS